MTNPNHNLFFTITKERDGISFSSLPEHNFVIKNEEQKPGTKEKCTWYYEFDPSLDSDCKWVSWNQGSNSIKTWEYLLIKIGESLYSGFINKSKTQANVYYCKLEPLPPKDNFEIIY